MNIQKATLFVWFFVLLCVVGCFLSVFLFVLAVFIVGDVVFGG